MSTWLKDLRAANPNLAADYAIVGNQSDAAIRNMIEALSSFRSPNADQLNRLEAGRRILAHNKRKAERQSKAPRGWDVVQA